MWSITCQACAKDRAQSPIQEEGRRPVMVEGGGWNKTMLLALYAEFCTVYLNATVSLYY